MNRRTRARWEKERAQLADEVGITEDDIERMLDALPYSSIPTLSDVRHVLNVVDEIRANAPKGQRCVS